MTETLGDALPKEIDRVREIQDQFKALRNTPGVMVEPQIMMMEASIGAAIRALACGDVVAMLRCHADLKGYEA